MGDQKSSSNALSKGSAATSQMPLRCTHTPTWSSSNPTLTKSFWREPRNSLGRPSLGRSNTSPSVHASSDGIVTAMTTCSSHLKMWRNNLTSDLRKDVMQPSYALSKDSVAKFRNKKACTRSPTRSSLAPSPAPLSLPENQHPNEDPVSSTRGPTNV